jgi:hypothetical protein
MRDLGAFVCVAFGAVSKSACALESAQGPCTASSHGLTFGWLAQAEDQVHPGEGCAELR